MAYQDMIQYANIHQAQRFLEPLGDTPVGIAGFRIAAGVVMHQNDSGGVRLNGVLDHFTISARKSAPTATP